MDARAPTPSTRYGVLKPNHGLTYNSIQFTLALSPHSFSTRYVIAVIAVYVDESVDPEEFKKIDAAAKRLNVQAWSAKLKGRLLFELSKRRKADTTAEAQAADGAQAARSTTSASDESYNHLLVLELADRNLDDVLTHDNIAGIDFARIRMIMSHLGKALNNLHSKKRIHADFKPLNAARESTWKLIDMDVSLKFGESFGTKLPSSGYCPPEVAKVLLAATDAETGVVDTNELAKYTASVAYDLWSFGVVLFNLCYGKPLFNNQNDNVSPRDLKALAGWNAGILNRKIEDANKPWTTDFKAAAGLIKMLLVSDPEERRKPFEAGVEMRSVLKHLFFQVGSELTPELKQHLVQIEEEQLNAAAVLDRVNENAAAAADNALAAATNVLKLITIGEEHQSELRRTREVLLKAVLEATEVKTPTAFIILEEKLSDDEKEEELMKKLKLKEDDTGFEVSGELAELVETVKGRLDTGIKWVERIKTFAESVVGADPIKTFDAMKVAVDELVTKKLIAETMYLYLIDELTGKPVKAVKGGIYPIKITTRSKIVPKLLPVMQVGIRAMSLCNGVAGIARMCGAPVLTMPTGWLEGTQESIALLGQKSSVEQFGVVHEAVMSEDATKREANTVRGASLRELQSFLKDKDKENTFAGLRRLGEDDGTAVWTVLTDEKEVRAAVEARAKERLAQQAAQERFYSKLLLERKEPTAGDSAGSSQEEVVKVEARAVAAEARAVAAEAEAEAAVAVAEARADAAEARAKADLFCHVGQCLIV